MPDPEFAFSFLYLRPITTATWLVGIHWGILVSVVSTFSWLLTDLSMIDRFSNSTILLVNESFRLMVFLFIVFMITIHKKILETQKELAMMDPLTEVANRRAFLQLAQTEIDRSRRYNHPFSVMVMDIDDFKQINDHFGHHTGDHLLITLAEDHFLFGGDIIHTVFKFDRWCLGNAGQGKYFTADVFAVQLIHKQVPDECHHHNQ